MILLELMSLTSQGATDLESSTWPCGSTSDVLPRRVRVVSDSSDQSLL